MRSVLGIDAAWTAHNPSGIALAIESDNGWRLAAVAPSYASFYATESAPDAFDADRLLAAATRIAGTAPDLIAVDMPLAADLITGRRISDNAVSARYGARGAGTHSPGADRPGPLGHAMMQALATRGYPLHCAGVPTSPATIEVYPHPALIELTGATLRLPYKIQNRGKYWPTLDAAARRAAIFAQWHTISDALDRVLSGTLTLLPLPDPAAPLRTLKAFEDALDAVICAWVGTCVLDGRAESFGDATSAIWVPRPFPAAAATATLRDPFPC
jgi:predicted RNase H-like nuclease